MSDFARLSNGFVNWQGQRVFVPWFGAPRIVPSAVGETRILRLRFAMDYAPILVVVLFFAIAWWIDGVAPWVTMAVLALGLGLFGLAVLLEQRWIGGWPRQSAAPLSRMRFMLNYYRSLSTGDRLWEVGWGVLGTVLIFRSFDLEFWASLDLWNDWLAAITNVTGVGLLMFFVFRHTAVSLMSMLPRIRRGTV
jgi:hypothetical protein